MVSVVRGGVWGYYALESHFESKLWAFVTGGLLFGPITASIGDLILIFGSEGEIEIPNSEFLRGGTVCYFFGVLLIAVGLELKKPDSDH